MMKAVTVTQIDICVCVGERGGGWRKIKKNVIHGVVRGGGGVNLLGENLHPPKGLAIFPSPSPKLYDFFMYTKTCFHGHKKMTLSLFSPAKCTEG